MPAKKPKVWMNTLKKQFQRPRWFELNFPGLVDFPTYYRLQIKENAPKEEDEMFFAWRDERIALNHLYKKNKPLPENHLPDIMYATSEIRKDIELPGLFQINNGYLMMTEPFAEIVQRFRIGSTQISPVSFYDLELDEPVNDRRYYFLNVYEWHSYFLPQAGGEELERTRLLSCDKEGNKRYFMPYDKNEEKLYFFSKAALDAPVDLWHDPLLDRSIFMSDALVNALKAEGFGSCLSLASCKLIDPS